MEDDQITKQLNEVDGRAHRSFRMAMTFIKRLLRDNEMIELKIKSLEGELENLRETVRNLMRIGDN
jgi:dynactin complex subunit